MAEKDAAMKALEKFVKLQQESANLSQDQADRLGQIKAKLETLTALSPADVLKTIQQMRSELQIIMQESKQEKANDKAFNDLREKLPEQQGTKPSPRR